MPPGHAVGWAGRAVPLPEPGLTPVPKNQRTKRWERPRAALCPQSRCSKLRKHLALLLGRQGLFWGAGTIPGRARERCRGIRDSQRAGTWISTYCSHWKKGVFPFSQQAGRTARPQRGCSRAEEGGGSLVTPPLPFPASPASVSPVDNAATSEGPWGWQGHGPGEEKALSGD